MPPTSPSLTTQRLEALSDGVIAIASTLLVLDIGRLEVHGNDDLLDAIAQRWPSSSRTSCRSRSSD